MIEPSLRHLAALVVKMWFCPHLHRLDRQQQGIVHCYCVYCRERWTVEKWNYKPPKGTPMKGKIASVAVTGAVAAAFLAVTPAVSEAFFALEATQWINKGLLFEQLTEDKVQSSELMTIDQQTYRSILNLPQNTHGMNEAAMEVARSALGMEGMPYELGAALGTHERTFVYDPALVQSHETIMQVYEPLVVEKQRAARENVAAIALQQEAATEAREAVADQVGLSQGAQGQTQALMAGNQIQAANFGKLDQMQAAIQAQNYLASRQAAAIETSTKVGLDQRNFDTRDFLTGPMPTIGGGAPAGWTGM